MKVREDAACAIVRLNNGISVLVFQIFDEPPTSSKWAVVSNLDGIAADDDRVVRDVFVMDSPNYLLPTMDGLERAYLALAFRVGVRTNCRTDWTKLFQRTRR